MNLLFCLLEAAFKIHLAQKSEGARAPLVSMGMTPLVQCAVATDKMLKNLGEPTEELDIFTLLDLSLCFSPSVSAPEIINYEPLGTAADMW